MKHDTLPSNPHLGLARPNSSLGLSNGNETKVASSGPILVSDADGHLAKEAIGPSLDETSMNGAFANTPDADSRAEMPSTSESEQMSRSATQETRTFEATTLQDLQRASATLELVKDHERIRQSSIVARARKAAAFRSPTTPPVRHRSLATTPAPHPFSPKPRAETLTVTAGSSRATSPSRTPSGRAKRRRKDRVPIPIGNPSLLSIEANDRRRSARVAKATVIVPNDATSNTQNLSQFGFSPFLENLVMGSREHDRRTRSGARATRPTNAPNKAKRPLAKGKSKEKGPELDSSEVEAKKELYRQLCILSYQLQAELDMVPFKTLDQLETDLQTPPPDEHRVQSDTNATDPYPLFEASRMHGSGAIKTEAHQYHTTPASYPWHSHSMKPSPEMSLANKSMRDNMIAYPSYHDQFYSRDAEQGYYEPLSPVVQPSRSNIMSISALMDGPAPSRPRYRTPTPERPMPWTFEDDHATQILSKLLAMKPKLDTTEIDRLVQIVQLAAIDVALPSSSPVLDQHVGDPLTLDPMLTLDMRQLFDAEEDVYEAARSACVELYDTFPYLACYDRVIDEQRANELTRLRLELQYRRSELERTWTCDRNIAWSNFVDSRAGKLYRKEAMLAQHQKWQARMELDLLSVHRRKTRAFSKLTEDIWSMNQTVGKEEKELYAKYGSFVYSAAYAGLDDPLVRGDLETLRLARYVEAQTDADATVDMDASDDELDVEAATVSDDVSLELGFESDWSVSSGITSLPSFTSRSASPDSIAANHLVSEQTTSTSVDADSTDDDDGLGNQKRADLDQDMDATHTEAFAAVQSELGMQKPSRKRKRPPPPGARVWKQGQVQRDALSRDEKAQVKSSYDAHVAHDLHYRQPASMPPSKSFVNGDADAQHHEHLQNLHFAEQQQQQQQQQERMLYEHEQQMYAYNAPRQFYVDIQHQAQELYHYPTDALRQNGDAQHQYQRPYYAPYHSQHPQHELQHQLQDHTYPHHPNGHQPQWPY